VDLQDGALWKFRETYFFGKVKGEEAISTETWGLDSSWNGVENCSWDLTHESVEPLENVAFCIGFDLPEVQVFDLVREIESTAQFL
jgi:hypothetical protein